jgi:hypothetical protein
VETGVESPIRLISGNCNVRIATTNAVKGAGKSFSRNVLEPG